MTQNERIEALMTEDMSEYLDYDRPTKMNLIEELQVEAGEAGDDAQIELCRQALGGDQRALAECVDVIREATAK